MSVEQGAGEFAVAWLVDEIEVGAALTRPAGAGPFPAIVMVAGSGPTDRNWNTPLLPGSNGSAALLARVLADHGFVVLRYDKRASGPNAPANAERLAGHVSMQSHVDELAGGVRLLATRADVDAGRIFALSNSEGAIHVLNYQTQQEAQLDRGKDPQSRPQSGPQSESAVRGAVRVSSRASGRQEEARAVALAGMVLTGAPARPVGVVAHGQLAAQLLALPGGAEQLAAYDRAMANFVAERPLALDPNLMEGVRNLILSITQPFNQPFARELWVLDPLAQLAAVRAPVLVLIGKKDVQVDWEADGSLFMALAQTQPNVEVVFAPEANHVLKHEARPREALTAADIATSYNAEGTVLDAEAVGSILGWLRKAASAG